MSNYKLDEVLTGVGKIITLSEYEITTIKDAVNLISIRPTTKSECIRIMSDLDSTRSRILTVIYYFSTEIISMQKSYDDKYVMEYVKLVRSGRPQAAADLEAMYKVQGLPELKVNIMELSEFKSYLYGLLKSVDSRKSSLFSTLPEL